MTLLEVAIITGTSFNERQTSNKSTVDKWLFSLHGVEVKKGDLLVGAYGRGKTLMMAKKDYASQLQSKMIVVHAMRPDKQEYLLPPKITARQETKFGEGMKPEKKVEAVGYLTGFKDGMTMAMLMITDGDLDITVIKQEHNHGKEENQKESHQEKDHQESH